MNIRFQGVVILGGQALQSLQDKMMRTNEATPPPDDGHLAAESLDADLAEHLGPDRFETLLGGWHLYSLREATHPETQEPRVWALFTGQDKASLGSSIGRTVDAEMAARQKVIEDAKAGGRLTIIDTIA